ncbi:NUDIX hydrolase [Candidatus Falkowbacteria bacterium]|nr:MAG: NUDIX hydrolase [Candidatus Falkowbacteria bacterium]
MRLYKIRPLALAFLKHKNKILVFKAKDKVKKEEFYRLLGGGIEFGEKAEAAVKREIKEEIGAEIKEIKLLDVNENIFNYIGIAMHEIVFIFKAKFEDKEFYKKNNIKIKDSKKGRKAVWVEIEELKKRKLYPEGIADLI